MSNRWWLFKPWPEKTEVEKVGSIAIYTIAVFLVLTSFLPGKKRGKDAHDEPVTQASEEVSLPLPPPAPRHNWTYRDGNQYGYEQSISDEQRAQGQVATKLLMFRFNGERDGKFQAYAREGEYASVLECQRPCEYVKSMVFSGRGKAIRTEHMRAVSGSIASALIEDMRDGDLELYTFEREGKQYSHWFDEKTGVQRIPVNAVVSDESK